MDKYTNVRGKYIYIVRNVGNKSIHNYICNDIECTIHSYTNVSKNMHMYSHMRMYIRWSYLRFQRKRLRYPDCYRYSSLSEQSKVFSECSLTCRVSVIIRWRSISIMRTESRASLKRFVPIHDGDVYDVQ